MEVRINLLGNKEKSFMLECAWCVLEYAWCVLEYKPNCYIIKTNISDMTQS